jgi:hypothetical protein
MTDRLYAKYLWLINTVYEAGKISFEEIASKWNDTYINDLHQPLRLRTFHNHRNAILMQFGIIIECERGVNLYYIDNPEAIERDSINQWLLDSFSVNNTLLSNKNLKDRILLEDIPSGRTHLDTITDAMQNNRQLSICYEDFFGERCDNLLINPYCLKMFKRRWYVLAYVPSTNIIRRFGLDRIQKIKTTENTFKYPKDFSPEEYFRGFFGVVHDAEPLTIQLKAYREKPNYLRSLPLHLSQQEVETGTDYAVFEYKIDPTFDFIQEILLHGDQLEVLSPQSFREHVASIIKKMHDFYE